MQSVENLTQRFTDVQGGVSDLMKLCRLLRNGEREALPETLQLIEDGLFAIGGELMMIPAALAAAEAEVAAALCEGMATLHRCQDLLRVYEQQAEANGLLPAILQDRQLRVLPPAASYPTDRFDVEVDAAAGVVVVREKPSVQRDADIIPLPIGLARHIYKHGRQKSDEPGGAA